MSTYIGTPEGCITEIRVNVYRNGEQYDVIFLNPLKEKTDSFSFGRNPRNFFSFGNEKGDIYIAGDSFEYKTLFVPCVLIKSTNPPVLINGVAQRTDVIPKEVEVTDIIKVGNYSFTITIPDMNKFLDIQAMKKEKEKEEDDTLTGKKRKRRDDDTDDTEERRRKRARI